MADRNAREGIRSLHEWGLLTRTDPTRPDGGNTGESGRADAIVTGNGIGVAIEFKANTYGFTIDQWKPNQRQWAAQYCLPAGQDYYLWITLYGDGVRPVKYAADWVPPKFRADPSRYRPAASWLIPYHAYVRLEAYFLWQQGDNPVHTIPYRALKGSRTVLQDNGLDCHSLFDGFELEWAGQDVWICHPSHVFYQRYLAPRETLVYEESDFRRDFPGMRDVLCQLPQKHPPLKTR